MTSRLSLSLPVLLLVLCTGSYAHLFTMCLLCLDQCPPCKCSVHVGGEGSLCPLSSGKRFSLKAHAAHPLREAHMYLHQAWYTRLVVGIGLEGLLLAFLPHFSITPWDSRASETRGPVTHVLPSCEPRTPPRVWQASDLIYPPCVCSEEPPLDLTGKVYQLEVMLKQLHTDLQKVRPHLHAPLPNFPGPTPLLLFQM